MDRRIRLGELLLRANLITELQLKTALAEQQKWGGRLGKVLVDMNYVSEDILIKALSRQLNVPRANLDNIQLPPVVLQKVDRAYCEQALCCPCAYSQQDRALQVALFDPTNIRVLDEIKFRTGLKVLPALAGEKAIALAIARLYHAQGAAAAEEEEFKVVGNNGATVVKKYKDVTATRMPAVGHPPPMAGGSGMPSMPGMPAMPGMSGVTTMPPMGAASAGPAPPNPWATAPPSQVAAGPAVPQLEDLDRLQKRQTRAIKALLELLIEKGLISREEYVGWLNRR